MSRIPARHSSRSQPLGEATRPQVVDSMKLLLIEDSRDLAANIVDYLEKTGCVVDFAPNGLAGLHLAVTERYDAILLDLNLPGINGIDMLHRLRRDMLDTTPVLILSARDTEPDRLTGFEGGADDYLTKPFSLPELHARLRAIMRRVHGYASATLRVGDLEFDPRSMQARRGARRLQVTPSGARILEKLMRASPALVTRSDLEHLLWGEHPPDSEAALRGHIHALRHEVDRDEQRLLLHTVHGVGYRLAVDDA